MSRVPDGLVAKYVTVCFGGVPALTELDITVGDGMLG